MSHTSHMTGVSSGPRLTNFDRCTFIPIRFSLSGNGDAIFMIHTNAFFYFIFGITLLTICHLREQKIASVTDVGMSMLLKFRNRALFDGPL